MFILRFNTSKTCFSNSIPCKNCISRMKSINGYKLRNIYYSDNSGRIVKKKISDIEHLCNYSKGHNAVIYKKISCNGTHYEHVAY
jgi:hypothetical protein